MPCFQCAAGRFSAKSSCLTTEGFVEEWEPGCSVSSPSPVLGEDTALLRMVAQGQQQFPALLPAAHATTGPFDSPGLRPEEPPPSGCDGTKRVKASQTGAKGSECIQPPPAQGSQLPVALGSVVAVKRQQQSWLSAPEMSGARAWGERSPLGSTAVQTASLTFVMLLAVHSLSPSSATSLLFQQSAAQPRAGPGALLGLSLVLAPETLCLPLICPSCFTFSLSSMLLYHRYTTLGPKQSLSTHM